MNNDLIILALQRLNEALTAATVIVATSMLLYNVTHSLFDRVVKSSSVLLGCVSITYIGDLFVSISKSPGSLEAWLRFQWIGIAFAPAALFHLSDALLATTGLVSRGRRRRVTRILYLYGVVFLLTATGTNLIVGGVKFTPMPLMTGGPLLWLYLVYFVASTVIAVNNVLRARRRCLSAATHRRMTYLLLVFLTPLIGTFPYSLLFSNPADANPYLLWALIDLGNLGIILMLAFMAYPLSFFGSNKPDRVIKAELLRFMMRGPVIGVLVLVVILFVPGTKVFGFPGDVFMPFAAVATVLGLQWVFTLVIPFLERVLIYSRDQDQARWIRDVGERLLTRADAAQLLEATLAAVCDYLRVPSAFVASIGAQGVHLEKVLGPLPPSQTWLSSPEFMAIAAPKGTLPPGLEVYGDLLVWQSFWLVPLYGTRNGDNGANHNANHNGANHNGDTNGTNPNANQGPLIGVMGVWARSAHPDLLPEEEAVFKVLCDRASKVLEGIRLEQELFAKFEYVLQETSELQYAPDPVRYNASALARSVQEQDSEGEPTSDFVDLIRNALRDWWGGPRLTAGPLLKLKVVIQALAENDGNPTQAVRAVLLKAIESLKPEGQRSMTTSDWILYNIVDLRFVQGRKVREVAGRLAMSEADLYRKQNIAIEQVARKIAEMEREGTSVGSASA